MNSSPLSRQEIVQAMQDLPSEVLPELANFIEYLHYKTTDRASPSPEQEKANPSASFLLSLAGLGASGEDNLSERDEEILAQEIDPIRGWSLQPDGTR